MGGLPSLGTIFANFIHPKRRKRYLLGDGKYTYLHRGYKQLEGSCLNLDMNVGFPKNQIKLDDFLHGISTPIAFPVNRVSRVTGM